MMDDDADDGSAVMRTCGCKVRMLDFRILDDELEDCGLPSDQSSYGARSARALMFHNIGCGNSEREEGRMSLALRMPITRGAPVLHLEPGTIFLTAASPCHRSCALPLLRVDPAQGDVSGPLCL
jgi:hypothetical protein